MTKFTKLPRRGCVFVFLLTAPAAFANEGSKSPFEFHAYGRLGISTNEKLNDAGRDQGDGAFGLPTSRHVRDTNYLRIQLQGQADKQSLFNLEAQLENLPHLTSTWSGTGLNLRNAYFQTAVSPETQLWFGARRLEFEDVRLFDRFPLSDTTFYGAGTTLSVAGAPTTIAAGFKNQSSVLTLAKNSTDATSGNKDVTATSRDTSLFIRHEHSLGEGFTLRPTLILNRSGSAKVDGVPLDSYKTVVDGNITTTTTKPASLTYKAGAVLSHGGDAGWGNHFVWLEQKPATGMSGSNNKDTIFGLASSGDYEGWKTESVGLMYGLMVEHTQFKKAQPKYTLVNDEFIPSATATSSSSTTMAVGLQPVYYITDRLHAALDVNHTLTTKVGTASAKPNMTFITPIVRFASNKTALATPQFFTSVTYGVYETKARLTASGKPSKTSITTQTGCEFWF